MFRRSFRPRSQRAWYIRWALLVLSIALILDTTSLIWISTRQIPQSPQATSKPSPAASTLFISSTHWNNERALRGFWNKALVELIEHVGPENVYISIYESGSWDDSKGALRALDRELDRLQVRRTIVLDDSTHQDEIDKPPAEFGWVNTPRGKKELRRIPFLANLRNLTLKPLRELAQEGVRFDRVLFLNDVAFNTQDIMNLLDTRDGEYAAACSIDFMKPPRYYDTFALRDSDGVEAVMPTFPYFRSHASREAMLHGRPVPVKSCWNGIVVFNAAPFYSPTPALRFRGIPDSLAEHHLEGSECCLIHADNPLSPSLGVWLNPDVRVGYSMEAYEAIHPPASLWPDLTTRLKGIWRNRFRRWTTFTFHKAWVVQGRLGKWRKQGELDEHRSEPGVACLINEMQVLVWNGWAHV